MRVKIRMIAVILAALLIASCSREGFEESLRRGENGSEAAPSSQDAQEEQNAEDYIFDLSTEEFEQDNELYYYALPIAVSPGAEEAADLITDELEYIVSSMAYETAAGREFESFTLYDAITKNDGEIFSVMYDIELSPAEGEDERYIVGLVFDAATGERIELDELLPVDTLMTLILDEQASELSGRDEELVAKKREYLRECGEQELTARLTASGGLDVLLDASYYVDGGKLVAVFSAADELGEAIEVSVDL